MENLESIQHYLCQSFCADVSVRAAGDRLVVPLPLTARDGDGINVYLERTTGGWRVTDLGTTMMRLSYDHDLSKVLSGTRLKTLQNILAETGTQEDDGEIFAEVPADQLMTGIFAVGQAATRAGDLSLWTRVRAESTFMDDLRERIYSSVASERVTENYVVAGVPEASDYSIDFKIDTGRRPLFIMGVSNRDKAKLATITFQHLRQFHVSFDAMAALSRLEDVPNADLRRLMIAANDILPSIDDRDMVRQKITHHLG